MESPQGRHFSSSGQSFDNDKEYKSKNPRVPNGRRTLAEWVSPCLDAGDVSDMEGLARYQDRVVTRPLLRVQTEPSTLCPSTWDTSTLVHVQACLHCYSMQAVSAVWGSGCRVGVEHGGPQSKTGSR
jgi:hypothetical protein